MALTVTPGTLRAEGPGFIPDTHYKAFIEGTDITGFGPEQFDRDSNNAIHFIWSSSEPPATSARSRSLMWFNRTDGHLYVWDSAWNSCDVTEPLGYWLSASDRKDILVRYHYTDPVGQLGLFPYGLLSLGPLGSADSNVVDQHGGMRRFVPQGNFLGPRWFKCLLNVTNWSLAGGSEAMVPACELGFIWGGVHSNSSGPSFGWLTMSNASPFADRQLLTSQGPAAGHWPYRAYNWQSMLALITSSGPASAYSAVDRVARMQVFLRPELSRIYLS